MIDIKKALRCCLLFFFGGGGGGGECVLSATLMILISQNLRNNKHFIGPKRGN